VKASRYNLILDLNDNVSLFFNFFTLSLVALKPPEARLGRKILADPGKITKEKGAKKLRKIFTDHGFLVAEGADERQFLKLQNAQARAQSDSLSLTIVPTLACNFRCRYCYQSQAPESMTADVEEAIVRYVEDNLTAKKSLHVTWFGGEPLLRMDIIERLSSRLQELCGSHSTQYGASIITNGYLLEDGVPERLARCGVIDAQVTVDGPAEIHDRRRPLTGGEPTFKKILANLSRAVAHLKIQVRMNVDDENRDRIPDLLDVLEAEGLKERVGFYLGHTYPYTNVCQDVASLCLKDEDFSLLELENALEMTQRGFISYPTPRGKSVFCMAERPQAYAVRPGGGLVKCWNDVANPEAEVGHLIRPETEKMRENAGRWRGRDVFEHDCRDCLALPICMGGCPYLHHLTGRPHCLDWKYHPEECLVFYYYLRKVQQETEIIREFWDGLESIPKQEPPDRLKRPPDPHRPNAKRRTKENDK